MVMNDKLTTWLASELKTRGWSIRELARRADIAHTTIADVLSGQTKPTWNFLHAIAPSLDQRPEDLARMAGLLPPLPHPVEEEREAIRILRSLPADLRAIAMNMLRSLKPPDDTFQPTLAEAPAAYETQGDPFVGVFGELWDQAPDWKKRDIITQLRTAVDEHQRTLKPEKE